MYTLPIQFQGKSCVFIANFIPYTVTDEGVHLRIKIDLIIGDTMQNVDNIMGIPFDNTLNSNNYYRDLANQKIINYISREMKAN